MITTSNYFIYLIAIISSFISSTALSAPIAAGANHGALIDEEGNVWTWGKNYAGQLGLGTYEEHEIPTKIPTLQHIVSIYLKGDCSFAIDSSGNVWAWGREVWNKSAARPHPTMIEGLTNIKTIILGFDSVFALDTNGNVWVWGSNQHNQLGIGIEIKKQLVPTKIEGLAPIKLLVPCSGYALALARDGSVWGWGCKPGLGIPEMGYSEPICIEARGKNIISLHTRDGASFALDDNGTVWALGLNQGGELGLGDQQKHSIFTQVETLQGKKIVSLFIVSDDCMALQDNGDVWIWGYKDEYIEGIAIPKVIKGLKNIRFLSSYLSPRLAVDCDGSVWAFGKKCFPSESHDFIVSSQPMFELGIVKLILSGQYTYFLEKNGNVWQLDLTKFYSDYIKLLEKNEVQLTPTLSEPLTNLLRYTSEIGTKRADAHRATAHESAEQLEGSSNHGFSRAEVSDPERVIRDEMLRH